MPRSIGIRTSRDLDISVLNICDITVLGTGNFGTESGADPGFVDGGGGGGVRRRGVWEPLKVNISTFVLHIWS